MYPHPHPYSYLNYLIINDRNNKSSRFIYCLCSICDPTRTNLLSFHLISVACKHDDNLCYKQYLGNLRVNPRGPNELIEFIYGRCAEPFVVNSSRH